MLHASLSAELPNYHVEVGSSHHNLRDVAQVINRAYRGVHYLKDDVERITEEELIQLVNNQEKSLYLCLSPENEICGTIVLDHGEIDEAEIALFSVDPLYQGRNVGSLLLEHAEQQAVDHYNKKSVRLNMIPLQEKLMRYYERHGYQSVDFVEFSDREKERFIRPEYEDYVFLWTMRKSLQFND